MTTALYPLFVRPKPTRDPVRDRQLVRYVDLLLRLVKQEGTPELMDRLERVLPYLADIDPEASRMPMPLHVARSRPPAGSRGTPRGRSARRHCSGCGSQWHDIRYHRHESEL